MAVIPNYYTSQLPYYNQQSYAQQMYPAQQSYMQPMQIQPQQNLQGVIFVDGEGAARAMQIPDGWDRTKSLAFWDMSAPYIYIRSFNQAGMPNPLMRLKYVIDDPQQEQMLLPQEQMSGSEQPEEKKYVTHEEMDKLEKDIGELKELLKRNQAAPSSNNVSSNNVIHTSNQNKQNRGGIQ